VLEVPFLLLEAPVLVLKVPVLSLKGLVFVLKLGVLTRLEPLLSFPFVGIVYPQIISSG
jgi:hypothetical protein